MLRSNGCVVLFSHALSAMPRLPKDGLGLSFFLSKAKAVRLYRDFLRAAQSLDTEARKHAV